jgi:uncharacterized iron-regulated membrane protein
MRPPLRAPRRPAGRRLLHAVHLYIGVVAGAYFLVVSVTGAALVLRLDMQRTLFPHLFEVRPGPAVSLADALQSVQASYPDAVVSGIDAPTATRPAVLAYVARNGQFLTVLVEPATGRVLGELPEHGIIRTLQDLHFNLLAGRTGRIVNGVGATCLLVMCITGVAIWLRGRRPSGRRMTCGLHRTVGVAAVAFIAMWGITGVYFAFPAPVRTLVNSVSTLSTAQPPRTDVALQEQGSRSPSELITEASRHMPGRSPARVVLPTRDTAPVQVLFARETPTPLTPGALEPVYLDRRTGRVIAAPQDQPSLGDRLLSWAVPLHVGNFAGPVVRVLWFLVALTPALLYATGMVMWWSRARRPAR